MIKTIDVLLFVEIIRTEGADEHWVNNEDGESIGCYSYKNGSKEFICLSSEFLDEASANNHLRKIGLDELIPIMPYT